MASKKPLTMVLRYYDVPGDAHGSFRVKCTHWWTIFFRIYKSDTSQGVVFILSFDAHFMISFFSQQMHELAYKALKDSPRIQSSEGS